MFEHLPADHRGGGLDDGEPVVGVVFPAGRDASPVAQPAVCALDRPAVTAVLVAGFGTAAAASVDGRSSRGRLRIAGLAAIADHRLDAPLTDMLS